jgi:hypothetical protein
VSGLGEAECDAAAFGAGAADHGNISLPAVHRLLLPLYRAHYPGTVGLTAIDYVAITFTARFDWLIRQ